MKKITVLSLFALIAIGFGSCMDGLDGESYWRAKNDSGFGFNFTVTDPNLPNTFYYDTYYKTKAGTYQYSYDYGIYNYSGTYTIKQNPGETWDGMTMGILVTGADGQDRHYTFDLDAPSGSELSYYDGKTAHPDIVVNKIITMKDGSVMEIHGVGKYDPDHLLNKEFKKANPNYREAIK